jgi:glutamyl aminopeptidase
VPVTWTSSLAPNTTQLKWLGQQEAMTEINLPETAQWIKLNVGQFGYYRVNYPAEGWSALADLLARDPSALGPMDRASLLNDAFSLAESGHIGYSVPLSMTRYLEQEQHLVPWDTVYDQLVGLGQLLQLTPAFPLFRAYVVELVGPHYDRLGWRDQGSHVERMNRYNILGLACKYGHVGCRAEAGRLFRKWVGSSEATYIAPNLRSLVYKYGMVAAGGPAAWDTVLLRFQAETNAQEKRKLLYGLAQVREPWVLHRFLRLAGNETVVRRQDYFTALSYIAGNPVGAGIVWDFLRAEWTGLVDRFSLNDRYLGRIPKTVSSRFATPFKLDQLKAFFALHPEAGAGARARKQAVEQVENNIRWLGQHGEAIRAWLEARSGA